MAIDIDQLVDENGQPIPDTATFVAAPPVDAEVESVSTADATPAQPTAGASLPPADDGAAGAATPTAPAAGEQPAEQPPQPWFADFGLPEEYAKDEATAKQALRTALDEARRVYEQFEDNRRWAEIGRNYARSQQVPAQQQVAQQPTATEPAAPAKPQADPLWERYRDPQTGSYLVEKMPAQMADSFIRYAQDIRTWNENFYRNPEAVLSPILEKTIKPFQEEITQLRQQLEQAPREAEARRFLAQNEAWMLQRNPLSGRAELTPAGHKFREFYTSAMHSGAPETVARDYAMTALQNLAFQMQMQQANGGLASPAGAAGVSAPAAQPADPRAALLATNPGAATKTPSRNGSVARESAGKPQFQVAESVEDRVTEHLNAALRKYGVPDNSQFNFAPQN